MCAAFFLGAVITTAPASLLLALGGGLPQDLQYKNISGTIWSGVLHEASISGADAGDIHYKNDPFPLILGKIKSTISLNGRDIYGEGVVSAAFGKKIQVQDANLNINLAVFGRRYQFMGSPIRGMASLKVSTLAYAKEGCEKASGDVWTDLLRGAVSNFSNEAFDLSGPVSCEDGNIKVALTGANAEGEASVLLVVNPQLRYSVTADVSAKRREVDQALRLMGFEEGPSGLIYDASGVFKGV